MASTYTTNLKLELIPTGAQSGIWGATTNVNLGSSTATQSGLEQAIVGTATLITADFAANVATYTLSNSNAYQVARAFVLDVTATLTAAGTINVPAIQKPYLVFNNSVGGFAVTVKVSGQTGVSIPNGKKAWLYNTGTDVGVAFDYAPSLVLGTPLLPASGGTGLSSLGTGVATFLGTPSSANLAAAVTDETGSGALVFANTPTLVTPILGIPTSVTLTNATGLPISTGVSGLGAGVATFLATPSSANLASAVTDETGTGSLVFANSPTLVTPNIGTPSTAVLTNATGLPLTTGVTGLLPVANGGTGTATPSLVGTSTLIVTGSWPNQTLTAVGSGFGDVVGPTSATDNAITRFDGTTGQLVQNSVVIVADTTGNMSGVGTLSVGGALTYGGVTLSNAVTGTGKMVLDTSPTLVTPNLGVPSFVTLTSATGLPLSTGVTGTLPVANGGTSLATLTANNVILGNGTSAPTFVAPSTSGNVLTSNGTTWQSTAASSGAQGFVTQFTGGTTPPTMQSSGFGLI